MKPKAKTKIAINPHRPHREASVESFRRDPKFLAAYLNAVLQDGDQRELLSALRYVSDAFGGVPRIAEKSHLNSTTLYRTLSSRGNPELRSFTEILKAVGMRLKVEPLATHR